MNREGLTALFINCQILSMLKLYILIPILLFYYNNIRSTYAISAYGH